MRIFVNKQGRVTKAEQYQGTNNSHPCLIEPAKKIALSYKFNDVSNDPYAKELQVGFVSINFDLGQ